MSKHKSKKNKTATPKEPITRRDLCERIRSLQIEINALRNTNAMLSDLAGFHKNTSRKALKLAEDSINDLERMNERARRYRITNNVAILALIFSGILHLINFFF